MNRSTRGLRTLGLILLSTAAMSSPACDRVGDLGEHPCSADTQCERDGEENSSGVCEAAGYCAFPDESCIVGRRYGDDARKDLAGECVPEDGAATGSGLGDESGGSGESDSAGGTTGDSGNVECSAEECGPAPGQDPMRCGTDSAPGPACERSDDGGCGWVEQPCPQPQPCTDAECGPAPAAPNVLCDDNETIGGPGECVRMDDGICGWEWIDCPNCCDPDALVNCPADKGLEATCCDDGSWACGADNCPGEVGVECGGGGM